MERLIAFCSVSLREDDDDLTKEHCASGAEADNRGRIPLNGSTSDKWRDCIDELE